MAELALETPQLVLIAGPLWKLRLCCTLGKFGTYGFLLAALTQSDTLHLDHLGSQTQVQNKADFTHQSITDGGDFEVTGSGIGEVSQIR